jgi:hypothetical protein
MKNYYHFVIILLCLFSTNFSYSQSGIEENCQSARNEYLIKNTDVKNAGLDPWSHYQNYGKKEGRKWPACTETTNTAITAIYSGNLDASKTGQGEVRFSTGYSYKGWIQNGIANGKNSEITTPKGSRYVGDFSFDGKNIKGSGTVFGVDGTIGTGTFEGDLTSQGLGSIKDGTIKTKENSLIYIANKEFVGIKMTLENWTIEYRGAQTKMDGNFVGDYILGYKSARFYFNIPNASSKANLIKIVDKNGITYSANYQYGTAPMKFDVLLNNLALPSESWVRASDKKVFSYNFETEIISEIEPRTMTKDQYNTAVRTKETEVYKCKCCKKPINGFINAVDKSGNDFGYEPLWDIRMNSYYASFETMQTLKNSEYYKNADLSPESVIQGQYPFCSQYCSKICKD